MDNKKPIILLVDDSQFSLTQMKNTLSDTYHIITANSGAEGLAKLEKQHVDLVITDLLMPQISGLAFLGQVRRRYSGIKVIICSADVQAATMRKAKALGAAAFFSKPIDAEEVKSVLHLVLTNEDIPRELSISDKHADAFMEMFNIGVGKAADSLSKLIYDTVKLSVPHLEILRPNLLADYITKSFTDEVACIRQNFEGPADGRAYLLLSAGSGANLVNSLVQNEFGRERELTSADREILVEIGNILINAVVGTLANTLGIDFHFGQAICNVMPRDEVYSHLSLSPSEIILYVETLFVVPGRQIGGNLAILLGSAGMGSLISGIDRIM